ncbi:unnamed protein product, partial [Meganyctiphanes norvegica]
MAKVGASLWVLAAVVVAQFTSRVVDGQENTAHPIDIIMNDELEKELPIIENFEDTNPAKVGDKDLFEADILLSDEQLEAILTRKAINDLTYRWSEGLDGFPYVPYVFQDCKYTH